MSNKLTFVLPFSINYYPFNNIEKDDVEYDEPTEEMIVVTSEN